MYLNLTLGSFAKIVDGRIIQGNPLMPFNAFITDSRKLTKGDIFWALKGEKFDGNTFLQNAVDAGASALVADKFFADKIDLKNTALVEVENTLTALQTLAAYHRRRSDLKVVAITGSNGKSTTKQMLLSICKTSGPARANMGNLNNQFGLPFSLLEIDSKDKFGVFELGASKKGDILEIGKPTLPDVAIITNVSAAHLQFFKDLKTVYETKTELIDCLNFGGILVFNSDDAMLKKLKTEYKGKAISFGFKSGADLQIKNKKNLEFVYKGEVFSFDLQFEKHNKLNAAAAAAGAIALGLYKDNIEKGLAAYEAMPMRMEERKIGNVDFILDCYNANPASMKNAITLLAKRKAGPRVAVLGDMKELGNCSAKYHAHLAKILIGKQIDYIFLSGPEMAAAAEALKTKNPAAKLKYSLEYKDWAQDLKEVLKNGGTCLIKASRSMNYEKILDCLK
ncbi:UDP-N-acetylmuramoylalanyl-D-glutamyl-2, 6-diaminopimelate/D-alanyl-D-alanyl ligase [Elusimicrobium minutum Pei191]|uniref:UDP-N-acetylmuramoyl-tripeptide--D-alanyl-D-alanine ligase n=1 Tax=Elusimicrobium minutum (strain Pei191) TaxID=445932 RepID=B2KE57_ELUMP|nr:UDP-N-acetylmuramoyl-tripeptide--D-alanyl-D-alanine ligase [Elusimicrobium minutum]ACC98803.1 UDP-N-acetylmuramoylalanyl-D-glutamyl-2, 6-diaminopimelate/D-alanyl-D-alanyl ligase [Elusimicrobium minutum Pei191]